MALPDERFPNRRRQLSVQVRRRQLIRATLLLFGSLALSSCATETPYIKPAFLRSHGFIALAHDAAKENETKPAPKAAPLSPIDEAFPRDFAKTRGFKLGAPRDMRPTEDGQHVFFLRAKANDARQSLWELDVASNAEREIVSPLSLAAGDETLSHEERARRERMRINTSGFTSYEATKDGSDVVLVLSGRLYRWSRKMGTTAELKTGAGAAIDPHLSPDGKRVAYVRDADVYAIALDGGKEERVTTGGTEKKTHGLAEFIAQEELDRTRGFWWSPDSKSILFEEADTSKVETLYIQDPAHPERAPDANPYPRAGTTNATLRFGVVSSHGGAVRWIAYDSAKYEYVATVTWSKNAPPTFYALDRAQRNGLLFTADPSTGKTKTLLEEHDDAWLNVDPSVPHWLDDGNAFLWSSEKSGRYVLELHDKAGALAKLLTSGIGGYRRLCAVDSKERVAYVEASVEPTEQRVASVSLDGAPAKTIVGEAGKFFSASFGDSVHVFAVRSASGQQMPHFGVLPVGPTQEGNVGTLASLAEQPPFFPKVEIEHLGPDHVRVAIVRPQKYVEHTPVALIDAAYGGPGYTTVVSDMSAYLRAQWIADATGAMVVSIDAKGTPYRGREWERELLNRMGDVPLEGHIDAIQELEKKFPEIDPTRVGIYGWSFGGYLSAYAALKRPDIFRVAVIGAPPADWRDYDTAYTERYLGHPQTNAAAYDAASLLSLAAKPASSPASMLIVHGTADDNVYFLNSLKLSSALATGHHPYEFVPIPGVTHQLYAPDTSGPVWAQMATFLRDHLTAKP